MLVAIGGRGAAVLIVVCSGAGDALVAYDLEAFSMNRSGAMIICTALVCQA